MATLPESGYYFETACLTNLSLTIFPLVIRNFRIVSQLEGEQVNITAKVFYALQSQKNV